MYFVIVNTQISSPCIYVSINNLCPLVLKLTSFSALSNISKNNLEKYKNLILEAKVMVEKMEGND